MSSNSRAALIMPLSIRSLTHIYGAGSQQEPALNNVSFEISNRELTAIVGPSGCGKSTLLSLVAGLRSIQSGSIQLNGVELKGCTALQLHRHRQQIGIIFQSPKLMPFLNTAENVLIGAEVSTTLSVSNRLAKIESLLMSVGMIGHSHKFPRQLSGGQCQRVSVARAIANDPMIIIADEPTASLDFKSTKALVSLLLDIIKLRDIPLLMATHDSRINEMADRVIQIDDGRVVSQMQPSATNDP